MKCYKCSKLFKTLACLFILSLVVLTGCNRADSGDDSRNTGAATPNPSQTSGASGESGDTPHSTPTADLPLTGIRICVDAGHQAKGNTNKEECAPWSAEANPDVNITTLKTCVSAGGTGVSTGIEEYKTNLAIALKLRDALAALGADIIMIRDTNDINITNKERALKANDENADITINIHCNGASSESVTGIEVYIRGEGDKTNEYAARSLNDSILGEKLLTRLVEATNAKKRSVNTSDNYTGINWRDHPTFIVECGFLSSPTEDALLNSDEYQAKLVSGFVTFFQEDYSK